MGLAEETLLDAGVAVQFGTQNPTLDPLKQIKTLTIARCAAAWA